MAGVKGYGAAYYGATTIKEWQVPDGFGVAANRDIEPSIDLNEHLIQNIAATFIFRMNSDSMIEAGIHIGDMLIVDRSIKAVSGKIIVAILNGELLVRRLQVHTKSVSLVAENKKYGNIQVDELSGFTAWGVVTYCIHALSF